MHVVCPIVLPFFLQHLTNKQYQIRSWILCFLWRNSPTLARTASVWRFLDHKETTHSLGLLWTRDRPVAETSTWQHTTLTRDRHPCPQRDSKPLSQQQATGRRTSPWRDRPLGSAQKWVCYIEFYNNKHMDTLHSRIKNGRVSLSPLPPAARPFIACETTPPLWSANKPLFPRNNFPNYHSKRRNRAKWMVAVK